MSPDILKVALDNLWAGVLALGGLVWKNQNDRLASMGEEINRQRDNIAKIFDKLEDNSYRAADRHSEVMMGQRELMQIIHSGLEKKADK